MNNIFGYSGHVGEEGRAREDDGVIADEAAEDKEEGIQIEEQSVAELPSPLEHLERQPPNEARSIDRNGDVCESNEKEHNIEGGDVVGANCPALDLFSTNGRDGQ